MKENTTIDVTNPKKSIYSCFLGEHYEVPPFQREYVWEKEEIEFLLKDIEEAYVSDKEKEYYLGTMVVFYENDKKQLIDGQQRMTTFFLILCAIARRYEAEQMDFSAFKQLICSSGVDKEGNTVNSYSLELQYDKSSACLKNVWEGTIPEDTEKLTKSEQRIYEGYSIIKDKLDEYFPDFESFKPFAGYFINYVVFIQIGAPSISDALKIFETNNQRGKGLNPLDLLKNMLFMQVPENTFEDLNKKWKQMMNKLEEMNENELRFLRYYLTATYDTSVVGDKVKEGIINENDIYKWLTENEEKCKYKSKPMEFTDNMMDGLERYEKLLSPDKDTIGKDYLDNITYLMGKSSRLHIVPLLAARGLDANCNKELYRIFEAIIYYSVVDGIKSNVIEKKFASWCPEIRMIRDQKSLQEFVKKNVSPMIDDWNKTNDYSNRFNTLGLGALQKYKIKTILARMTKYIESKRNRVDSVDISELLKPENTIEHIMPQEGKSYEAYKIKDKEEYDVYKNRLGNLSILEKVINSSIQDDLYEEKCKAYKASKFYLTSSVGQLTKVGKKTAINKTNQMLRCWETWNKETIEQRQDMMLELSRQVWKIQ